MKRTRDQLANETTGVKGITQGGGCGQGRLCREILSVGTNMQTRVLQMSISKPYDGNHQGPIDPRGTGWVLGQCQIVGAWASMGAYRQGRAYQQGRH